MDQTPLEKALRKIDRLAIDGGLEVTLPESEARSLIYCIHTIAIQAIQDTKEVIEMQTILEAALEEIHAELEKMRKAFLDEGKVEVAAKIQWARTPITHLLTSISLEDREKFMLEEELTNPEQPIVYSA